MEVEKREKRGGKKRTALKQDEIISSVCVWKIKSMALVGSCRGHSRGPSGEAQVK